MEIREDEKLAAIAGLPHTAFNFDTIAGIAMMSDTDFFCCVVAT